VYELAYDALLNFEKLIFLLEESVGK